MKTILVEFLQKTQVFSYRRTRFYKTFKAGERVTVKCSLFGYFIEENGQEVAWVNPNRVKMVA